MTMAPLGDNWRPLHVSLDTIRAALDQAYAAEREEQQRIKYLTELLVERAAADQTVDR